MRDTLGPIRAAALAGIETLAARLLPHGKREGNLWRANVPWRADNKPSLVLYFNSGRWMDLAEGETGSIFDLVAKLHRCSLTQARDTIAQILGVTPDRAKAYRPPPVPKCPSCRHCWQAFNDDHVSGPDGRRCLAVTLPQYDDPMPTRIARRPEWKCGPAGKLYAPRVTGPPQG